MLYMCWLNQSIILPGCCRFFSNWHKQLSDEFLIKRHRLPTTLLKVSLDSSRYPLLTTWLTGTQNLSPHWFSKAKPSRLSIQCVPQTHQDHSSPHTAGKTTDKFYQIITWIDPRKTLVPPKWAPLPPAVLVHLAWNLQPCWSVFGYRPPCLGGLKCMVCRWINIDTDKPNRLIRGTAAS